MRTIAIAVCALALLVGGCARADQPGAAGDATSSETDGSSATTPVGEPTPVVTGVPGGPPATDPTDPSGPSVTSPVATGSGAAGPDRCRTAQLSGRLQSQDAGMGSVYVALVLTNNGRQTCRIHGYGGLQLLDAAHRPIPTVQSRDLAHPPASVLVPPHGTAVSQLRWGQVPTGDEPVTGPCEPRPSFLAVIPPDETERLLVAWQGGSVCKHGAIDQWAYAAKIVAPS